MSVTMVRMGELAATAAAGDVLRSLGLSSCIGLALLDRRMGVAGLAHVVLPASGEHEAPRRLKLADHAVPELIERVVGLGGRKARLEAALVGRANMFAAGSPGLEVGERNEAAVRALLDEARIPVLAAATGGAKGRTIRVEAGSSAVTVKEAGGTKSQLLAPYRLPEVAA